MLVTKYDLVDVRNDLERLTRDEQNGNSNKEDAKAVLLTLLVEIVPFVLARSRCQGSRGGYSTALATSSLLFASHLYAQVGNVPIIDNRNKRKINVPAKSSLYIYLNQYKTR